PSAPHPQDTDCTSCHTDPGGSWDAVSWDHTPKPSACASCHEGSRPSSPHPQDTDCTSCHTDPGGSWDAVTWDHTPTPNSCASCHEGSRPSAPHPQDTDCTSCHTDPGGSWDAVSWDHTPKPSACASCHEGSRPSSPHPQDTDCTSCHTDPGGSWDAVSWDHTPKPSACASCHEGSRPSSPHPQDTDCTSCHTDPGGSWDAVTWDHTPTPNSCASCHEGSRPSAPHPQDTDCTSCHTDPGGSWSAVTWDHTPSPSSCVSCHESDRPGSGHPQGKGKGKGTDCVNCHSPGGSWDDGDDDDDGQGGGDDGRKKDNDNNDTNSYSLPARLPDFTEVFFMLDERSASTTASDTRGLFVGIVNDPFEAFWGDGLFHGDGAFNYIDFEDYDSFLQASRALTITVRMRPVGIATGNYATRILARDSNRNYHLSVWRDVSWGTYNPPDNVASIAFWISPVDRRGGASWKPVLTDCGNFPILNDHWYLVKVVWNSEKKGTFPCDIFMDDQGTDGLGTKEQWSGYRNATDARQSQLPPNHRLYEGDQIAVGNGDFTIGTNVNNHAYNNFIGEIDWIFWRAKVDYSGVDDSPN
ncbi:hypothetical protein ACFL5Z_20520, partial [Planctomycetota bacterium]